MYKFDFLNNPPEHMPLSLIIENLRKILEIIELIEKPNRNELELFGDALATLAGYFGANFPSAIDYPSDLLIRLENWIIKYWDTQKPPSMNLISTTIFGWGLYKCIYIIKKAIQKPNLYNIIDMEYLRTLKNGLKNEEERKFLRWFKHE